MRLSDSKTVLIKCGKTAAVLIGLSALFLVILNFLKLDENIESNIKLLFMPVLCIPVAVCVIAKEYDVNFSKLIPKRPNNIKSMILFILCSELVLLVIAFILGLIFPNTDEPVITSDMALYCVSVCIIGPIAEEVLYRGVLCNQENKINTIIVAILFSLMHFSVVNFVFYLIMLILLLAPSFISLK